MLIYLFIFYRLTSPGIKNNRLSNFCSDLSISLTRKLIHANIQTNTSHTKIQYIPHYPFIYTYMTSNINSLYTLLVLSFLSRYIQCLLLLCTSVFIVPLIRTNIPINTAYIRPRLGTRAMASGGIYHCLTLRLLH